MAAALAATAPSPASADLTWTISITGATASTAYVVEVTAETGEVVKLEFTSDGSGAGSVKYVPQADGSFTAALRPKAAYTGTTTAEATLAAQTVQKFN